MLSRRMERYVESLDQERTPPGRPPATTTTGAVCLPALGWETCGSGAENIKTQMNDQLTT